MNDIENIEVNDITPITFESLQETTYVKKITPINQVLWERINLQEMKIEYEKFPDEEKKKETTSRKKTKSKKIGNAAFVSVYAMTVISALVTSSIIILGVMLTK